MYIFMYMCYVPLSGTGISLQLQVQKNGIYLKAELNWTSVTGPFDKNAWNENYTHGCFSICFSSWLLKMTFEGHKNMTLSAAILCPAVCVRHCA